MQLNFLLDDVAANVQKLHAGRFCLLLPITNELLWYNIQLHIQRVVVTSCIAMYLMCHICQKNQKGQLQLSFQAAGEPCFEVLNGTH